MPATPPLPGWRRRTTASVAGRIAQALLLAALVAVAPGCTRAGAPLVGAGSDTNAGAAPAPADARTVPDASGTADARTAVLADPVADRPAAASRPVPAAARSAVARADFGRTARVSRNARRLADWIAATRDNGAHDFVLVDKRAARVYVFDADARLQADAPALLGAARGDHTVPGIGDRPLAQVRPHERTTPAGRFVAEPGVNAGGEDVVWVDYDAAVSMHRVRTANPAERRQARLDSPGTADNRISWGCINLPVRFYESQLRPRVHGGAGAVVYVLPEVRTLEQVFGLPAAPRTRRAPPPAPGKTAAPRPGTQATPPAGRPPAAAGPARHAG